MSHRYQIETNFSTSFSFDPVFRREIMLIMATNKSGGPATPPPLTTTEINRLFGERIEEALGEREITKVATAIKTTHPNLRQAIDGDRPLPPAKTVALARLLKKDIEDFIPRGDLGPAGEKKAWHLRQLWKAETSGSQDPDIAEAEERGSGSSDRLREAAEDYIRRHDFDLSPRQKARLRSLKFKLAEDEVIDDAFFENFATRVLVTKPGSGAGGAGGN